MAAYLLDTNICIYIIKKKPPNVLLRFANIDPGDISISTITIAELEFGARKSTNVEKNLAALHKFLIPFNVLQFDQTAASIYGVIRAE